ncbi:MAG: hypothetical protein WCY19_06855 [Candidatus Gastranaerophilaceae bacterium]
MSSSILVNSSDIIVKKPVEISFSGLFTAEVKDNLENNEIELSNSHKLISEKESGLNNLIKEARKFISPESANKGPNKKIVTLIAEAIDFLQNTAKNESEKIKNFVNSGSNKENLNNLIDASGKILSEAGSKKPLQNKTILKLRKNMIKEAVQIIQTVENPAKIHINSKIKHFLGKAANAPVVFSALFALLLTGILRPAAIMSLPGQKNNKDDKKYASAHSIASGIIGYLLSFAVFYPLSAATKKVGKNPQDYLDAKKAEYLGDIRSPKFRASKDFNRASKFLNMVPDALIAPARAALTVALIPPILKYVFGWEKKKGTQNEKAAAVQNYTALNFKSLDSQNRKVFQNFKGGLA